MTDTASPPPAERPPYLSLGVIFAAMGTVCMVVINRWTEIEPILQSPAMIVLAMLTNFFSGVGSCYWLAVRPLTARLVVAEATIKMLRDEEADLLKRVSGLEVAKARLEERLVALEARLEALQAPARKPRAPKT